MFILNLNLSDQILVFSQYNCSISKLLNGVIIVVGYRRVFSFHDYMLIFQWGASRRPGNSGLPRQLTRQSPFHWTRRCNCFWIWSALTKHSIHLYPLDFAFLLNNAYVNFYSWTEYIWAHHQKLPLLIMRRKEHLLWGKEDFLMLVLWTLIFSLFVCH